MLLAWFRTHILELLLEVPILQALPLLYIHEVLQLPTQQVLGTEVGRRGGKGSFSYQPCLGAADADWTEVPTVAILVLFLLGLGSGAFSCELTTISCSGKDHASMLLSE